MDNFRIEFGALDAQGKLISYAEFNIADQLVEARKVFTGMASNPINGLSEQLTKKGYYSVLKHNDATISNVKTFDLQECKEAVDVVVLHSENYKKALKQ